jgi:hypothetical protein
VHWRRFAEIWTALLAQTLFVEYQFASQNGGTAVENALRRTASSLNAARQDCLGIPDVEERPTKMSESCENE